MKETFEELVKKYPKGPINILIPGHGGVDKYGVYHIKKEGSKQAEVNGKMVYEGEHNRLIKDAILEQRPKHLRMVNMVPEVEDISLPERVKRINDAYPVWTDSGFFPIVWELHLNAFNNSVYGTEVFTTRRDNFSDTMATIWWEEATRIVGGKFPDYKWRPDYSDGDPDKEADFYVIKHSKAYGILMEFFFFDNAYSVDTFLNPFGYNLWASTVVAAMERISKHWGI